MYELITDYGMTATHWLLLAVGLVLTRYVFPLVKHAWANGVLQRAWTEVKAAVMEVGQTYVDALKEANVDGKLTDAEKAEAKLRAVNKAKELIGVEGLKRLAKILGVDVEKWLGNKVEAAVSMNRTPSSSTTPDPQ